MKATINYFDPTIGRGRFDLINPSRNRMAFLPCEMQMHDLRTDGDRTALDVQGFMQAQHRSEAAFAPEILETNLKVESGVPPVNKAYYDEVLPLIREISGAQTVIPQATGLTVRFSKRSERQSWAGAAGFAHLDVTAQSAARFLQDSLDACDEPPRDWTRYVMFQTWRAVAPPPQDNLLALCDRSTVSDSDVIFYDAIIGEEGTTLASIEARSCRYNENHAWWFLSDMGPDDLLVFIGFDSQAPDAVQPFHTGFDIPGNENANHRISLEARFFAFYD